LIIKTLGEIKASSAFEKIASFLHTGDDSCRYRSIEALYKIDKIKLKPYLITLLDDESFSIRKDAVFYLGELKASDTIDKMLEMITPLISSEQSALSGLDVVVFEALAKIKDVKAVPVLLKILENWHINRNHKIPIINSLGDIGEPSSSYAFVKFLTWSDKQLDEAIKIAIGKLGLQAVDSLKDFIIEQTLLTKEGYFYVNSFVNPVAACFVAIGKSAIPTLLELLEIDNIYLRRSIIMALDAMSYTPHNNNENIYYWIAKEDWNKIEQYGNKATEALCKSFFIKEKRINEGIITTLGKIKDINSLESILVISEKHWFEVSDDLIVEALGSICENNVTPLLEFLNKKNYRNSRIKVIKALGKTKDSNAISKLIEILKEYDYYEERREAAEALGNIGDTAATKHLITSFHDKSDVIKEASAIALGKIADLKSVKPLIATLKTDFYLYATQALSMIGTPCALPYIEDILKQSRGLWLEENKPEIEKSIMNIFDSIDDKIEIYLSKINDTDEEIRSIARLSVYELHKRIMEFKLTSSSIEKIEQAFKTIEDDEVLLSANNFFETNDLIGQIDNIRWNHIIYHNESHKLKDMISSLSRIGCDETINYLLDIINPNYLSGSWSVNDLYLNRYAISALAKCVNGKNEFIEEAIIKCITHSDKYDFHLLLKESFYTLSKIGGAKSVDFILGYINYTYYATEYSFQETKEVKKFDVAESAIYALGKLGDTKVIPSLCKEYKYFEFKWEETKNINIEKAIIKDFGSKALMPLILCIEENKNDDNGIAFNALSFFIRILESTDACISDTATINSFISSIKSLRNISYLKNTFWKFKTAENIENLKGIIKRDVDTYELNWVEYAIYLLNKAPVTIKQ